MSYLLGSIQGQDAECTYRLGDCYMDGEFVKKDENVAFTLYYKAYDYESMVTLARNRYGHQLFEKRIWPA